MNNAENCKICAEPLKLCYDEGFVCSGCSNSVHLRCLKNSPPPDLNGDLFFVYTCANCTKEDTDTFIRERLSWLKAIVLVLYHLQTRSPGLAKKGFFHWRYHIGAFINKNWDLLFTSDVKQKKKWIGTVAGTLSHFSNIYFKSGTLIVNEPAWWALCYPKLTPTAIAETYESYTREKVQNKMLKKNYDKYQLFQEILPKIVDADLLNDNTIQLDNTESDSAMSEAHAEIVKDETKNRKRILPTFAATNKKLLKLNSSSPNFLENDSNGISTKQETVVPFESNKSQIKIVKLLDPMCHYNTSLMLNCLDKLHIKQRLTGSIRKDFILSPYSGIYLKPYIRRDTESYPNWIKLMTEMQLKANEFNKDYVLPPMAAIDYTYVQPEHIPAINSLCNIFFWPGIDISECLQYPDFSCVVLYKKLIIGFAFLVPDVKYTENYLSFLFTRPGWRNVGIGRFMLYHLIQTTLGKDLTLHVSINNPALVLYQKFGFKVETVVLDFYDKYILAATNESKHAFFCRLER